MSDKINLPPVAHNTLCVDFDGTIFQWGDIDARTPPFDGAVEFLRQARKEGWNIVIFTSRMSPTWWSAEGWNMHDALGEQITFITGRLKEYGIPFDRITAEKVPAEYYIDDKAIRFNGDNWKQIAKEVLK